ncbi:MAG: hypothetical protein H0U92_13235 [Actinobacteria bacterium]|nr:hypothetical protein [Actinomycetota bacterium]
MAVFDDNEARARVGAALDALVPGASQLGAVDYVENLLSAFDHDPPRVWAAPGAWSGGPGGWLEMGPWEEHAWRTRIELWTEVYARVARGDELSPSDHDVLHQHACEATYGDPAYGGNRDEGGWRRVNFPTPLFPPARSS